MKNFSFILIFLIIFTACSSKKETFDDYNLSDKAWLDKILKNIEKNELDKADNNYTSLYSEHINSPLLKSATLILSKAHSNEHEYDLANYYIDEYIKLYADANNIEWLNYLRIKNLFKGIALPKRNQFLLLKAIEEVNNFKNEYPESIYIPYINTIENKLMLTQLMLDKDILKLYKKLDYEESVLIYKKMIEENTLNEVEYIEPKLPWYRKIFE